MQQQLMQQFYYDSEGSKVRTVKDDNDNVWFCAKDVCNILEIQNVTKALLSLDEDERSIFKIGRPGNTNFVNESGLYALIFKSKKPEAKKFRKWVTSVVLPSLRQQYQQRVVLSFAIDVTTANRLRQGAKKHGMSLSRYLANICIDQLHSQLMNNNEQEDNNAEESL